jgi:hypothetical protein
MVRYDTLKLEIPTSAVRGIDWDGFTETQKADMKTGVTETFRQAKSDYLPTGVSQIIYKDGGDYQVTLSAKTLKDDYLQGINLNNWDRAINGVSSIMDIDTNTLWDANPIIYRCDTTDNITLDKLQTNQKGVCQALLSAKMNDRFVSKWYESKRKLGVEFAGTQQEKNRLIVYSKNLDLLKKENRGFMSSLTNPVKMIRDAENMIRVETNHTTFKSLRDRFGIADNRLQSMLNAPLPVNHNFLKKVLNTRSGQMTLFEQYQSMKTDPMTFIYMKGIEGIIYELGCSELSVKQFFKQLLGDRFKYFYYKSAVPISKLIKKVKTEQTKDMKSEVSTICQRVLDELLKAA